MNIIDDKTEKLNITKDPKSGKFFDGDGTEYQKLTESDISIFCNKFKGDKISRELGEIYMKKVPKGLLSEEYMDSVTNGVYRKVMGEK